MRVPAALGVKVMLAVQEAPTASENGQLVVNEKSLALLPVNVPLTNCKAKVPVFVTVKVCAALCVPTVCAAKVKPKGARVTTGEAACTVPGATIENPTRTIRRTSTFPGRRRAGSSAPAFPNDWECERDRPRAGPVPFC